MWHFILTHMHVLCCNYFIRNQFSFFSVKICLFVGRTSTSSRILSTISWKVHIVFPPPGIYPTDRLADVHSEQNCWKKKLVSFTRHRWNMKYNRMLYDSSKEWDRLPCIDMEGSPRYIKSIKQAASLWVCYNDTYVLHVCTA